ncbi:SDR family oxidoreductase [Diaphorobacter sp.]|uniref:SDR family oxidoreductase n=1 Tax=Diaphorobacter sp. TaxID=1934310 RepID=UPI0028AB3D40|nr:SDR family oxidoreductase [Diaphorobacter sp.]
MAETRVAVVVAGGSGMGAAAARRLARDGYQVAILSSSGKGEALATELGGVGVTGSNLVAGDVQRLIDQTMARWGRIDVLVNGAGHGPKGPLLAISDEDWVKGFNVYFLNVVRATRMVAPIMQQQKKGSIINISTAWVDEPSELFPTSAVARSGLTAFTKLFCDQYAKDGIRMNNVLPGWIDSLPQKDERRDAVPMQRYGTADEIAGAIAFLASDDAAYITGQSLRVDGGLMRSV